MRVNIIGLGYNQAKQIDTVFGSDSSIDLRANSVTINNIIMVHEFKRVDGYGITISTHDNNYEILEEDFEAIAIYGRT